MTIFKPGHDQGIYDLLGEDVDGLGLGPMQVRSIQVLNREELFRKPFWSSVKGIGLSTYQSLALRVVEKRSARKDTVRSFPAAATNGLPFPVLVLTMTLTDEHNSGILGSSPGTAVARGLRVEQAGNAFSSSSMNPCDATRIEEGRCYDEETSEGERLPQASEQCPRSREKSENAKGKCHENALHP